MSAKKAFTLIETIAVVVAIGALAAALLVPMIRRLDEAARQKEANTLASFADAFKQRALVTKNIPNESGWASAVATVNGLDLNSITANDRGNARLFLIDPALRIGNATNVLPYTQAILTNFVRPVSPRLMLVSSVSKALPTNLVSGVAPASGSNSFNNLWITAEGAIPTGWTWTGRGDDLKIQRIDLSDLFVKVALNNRDATLVPSYVITVNTNQTATNTVPVVPNGCPNPLYLLKGTEIQLYNALGTNEYSEILSQSQSYTFEYGTWEPESFLATSVGQTSPLDLAKMMDAFMRAPAATNSTSVTQAAVSNAVVNFMTEYNSWRDGNPAYKTTGGGKPPAQLDKAQTDLAGLTSDLLKLK
jgi:type II secretory pathway pseudopilin PulG